MAEEDFDRSEHMRSIQKQGQEALTKKRKYYEAHPEERPLNEKQREFAYKYVFDPKLMGKKAECYADVYGEDEITDSTYNKASKLMRKENIKAEIEQLKEDRLAAYEHIKYSNIETLLKVRDEMAELVIYRGGIDENGEPVGEQIATHQQRMAAVRAVEVLNKMLGFNKPTENNVNHKSDKGFVLNVIVPGQQPADPDTLDVEYEEDEDDPFELEE